MKSVDEMVLEAVEAYGAVEVLLSLALVVEQRTLEFGDRRRPNRKHKGNPSDSPISPLRIRGLLKSGVWYTVKQVSELEGIRQHVGLYSSHSSFRSTICSNMQKCHEIFLCDRTTRPIRFRLKGVL